MKALPLPYLSEKSSGKIHCKICNQDLDRRGLDAHLGGRTHQQRVALITDNGQKDVLRYMQVSRESSADTKGKPTPSEAAQSFSQEAVGAFISNSSLEDLFQGEKLMIEGLSRIANEINERLQKLGLRRERPTGVNAPSHIE